jgi:hypothetical protein
MQGVQSGLLILPLLIADPLITCGANDYRRTTMRAVGTAFLWPGEALCNLVGVTEEGDSKHLLRMFFNLAIWSKVGAMIAVYWVDLGL